MTRRRRAFTMIEAIVVVAMSGIVLMTGVSLIHLVLGVERTTRQSVHLSTAGSLLSRVFRHDVQTATELDGASSNNVADQRLQLHLPDNRVVNYQVESNRLARRETENGKRLHQDDFVFPAGSRITLRVSDDPDRVSVSIREANVGVFRKAKPVGDKSQAETGFVLRIEATIGRDARYGPNRMSDPRPR